MSLEKIREFFDKRRAKKQCIQSIVAEVDPSLRAHAAYVFTTLELEKATELRPLTLPEYEAFLAYMMSNVLTSYPDSKGGTKALGRINNQARIIRDQHAMEMNGPGSVN